MGGAIDNKMASAGRSGRSHQPKSPLRGKGAMSSNGATPDFDVCCPHCQEKGDFLREVNKVLKNCIDFCEFPHRCPSLQGNNEIIWKTLSELQAHA
jgi:hypothetical protein